MRDHILNEIRRVAGANDGQPPGVILFARETGIAEHQWRGKIWARWGDALAEAGFKPNPKQARLDSDAILSKIADACRQYGRLPTHAELKLYRQKRPFSSEHRRHHPAFRRTDRPHLSLGQTRRRRSLLCRHRRNASRLPTAAEGEAVQDD